MVDLTHLIRHHRADTAHKAELIKREIAEITPIASDEPPIRFDRNDMVRPPVDPAVAKAMAHARDRMKFYERELRRKRR
jgi:hypothetical protein